MIITVITLLNLVSVSPVLQAPETDWSDPTQVVDYTITQTVTE